MINKLLMRGMGMQARRHIFEVKTTGERQSMRTGVVDRDGYVMPVS